MKFQLVDAEKAHFPVSVLCEVLAVSRSGFYAWKTRLASPREKADARLAAQLGRGGLETYRARASEDVLGVRWRALIERLVEA